MRRPSSSDVMDPLIALVSIGTSVALREPRCRPDTTRSATLDSGRVLLSERAPSHHPDGSFDADCPICALIQLVATSVPSVAPVLPLPTYPASTGPQAPAELASASSPHFLFQARAPPSN